MLWIPFTTYQFPKWFKISHSCSCSEVLSTLLDITSPLLHPPLCTHLNNIFHSISFSMCCYHPLPHVYLTQSSEKITSFAGKRISRKEVNSAKVSIDIYQLLAQTQRSKTAWWCLKTGDLFPCRGLTWKHIHPPMRARDSTCVLSNCHKELLKKSMRPWSICTFQKKTDKEPYRLTSSWQGDFSIRHSRHRQCLAPMNNFRCLWKCFNFF